MPVSKVQQLHVDNNGCPDGMLWCLWHYRYHSQGIQSLKVGELLQRYWGWLLHKEACRKRAAGLFEENTFAAILERGIPDLHVKALPCYDQESVYMICWVNLSAMAVIIVWLVIVVLSGTLLFLGVTKKSSKGHLRGWKNTIIRTQWFHGHTLWKWAAWFTTWSIEDRLQRWWATSMLNIILGVLN